MLAGFFLKKVVFTFSESGLFFSFSLFFVLTCCKLGALDFIILLRFHSNRIIQTRIFLYVCKTPARSPPPLRPRNPPRRRLRHKGPRLPGLPRRGRRRRVRRRLGNEPPSPPRGAASASAPKIQTSIFCTGVVSEIQNDI